MDGWTPERDSILTEMWNDGALMETMGARFGVTNHAVAWRVGRLRLPKRESFWTNGNVDLLKKRWADGLSGSQIAAEFGGGVTRNAVIGKVHRLGLPVRPRAPSKSPRKRRASFIMRRSVLTNQLISRARRNLAMAQAFEYDLAPEIVDSAIPVEQRRTLLELTAATCKWPIGTPGEASFFFCGGQTLTSMPYCSYHCRVAYQPVATRRDQRPVPM